MKATSQTRIMQAHMTEAKPTPSDAETLRKFSEAVQKGAYVAMSPDIYRILADSLPGGELAIGGLKIPVYVNGHLPEGTLLAVKMPLKFTTPLLATNAFPSGGLLHGVRSDDYQTGESLS